MRAIRTLALLPLILLSLLSTSSAFAAGLYQVEVIVFRQAGEPIRASQPAPEDWSQGAQPIDASRERSTAVRPTRPEMRSRAHARSQSKASIIGLVTPSTGPRIHLAAP